MGDVTFTPQEITDNLARLFAAPLIISTIGWIFYGFNLCQYVQYMVLLSKRDHLLTRVWLTLVVILTSASLLHQVYYDWTYSIIVFTESIEQSSMANGTTVALYSSVIFLVQLFWLACVKRMMTSKPTLSWFVIAPIGVVSFGSFVLGITVGALSNVTANEDGSWPNGTISIILRTMLGLDVGIDVSVLVVVLSQLLEMRKSSGNVKRTISKLSYILLSVTLVSAIFMIAELVINFPHLGRHGTIHITISFSPIIANLYCYGILAVLNARTDLWLDRRRKPLELEGNGLVLSVVLPPEKQSEIDPTSRDIPLSNLNFEQSPKEQEVDA